MNYIGHLLITYPYERLSVGNLLGDLVRNKHLSELAEVHRAGVVIHRYIDTATDSHPLVRELYTEMRPSQGKYAPVAVDILFDHAICRSWSMHADTDFNAFQKWIYSAIGRSADQLPEHAAHRLLGMAENRWLEVYTSARGIEKVLRNMDRRARFPSSFHTALDVYTHREEVFRTTVRDVLYELRRDVLDRFGEYLAL